MIHFECDYTEGAHPKILEKLVQTNMEQTSGYGIDPYCEHARDLIKKQCGREDVDVQFLVGGTQTNMTVIAASLRPYMGVIAADSGHINVHETGAIEATGHKVLPLASTDGKLKASQIETCMMEHLTDESMEHTVRPGMVYISNPTETGTLYSKEELYSIHNVCVKYKVPLFLDGARLGYGLASPENDLTMKDIADCCDVFYIGGTKVGALFGEAVVIKDEQLKKDFRYMMKQRGGLLAKGRLLGIQFQTLFLDDLYYEISKHAIALSLEIKKAFQEKGIPFLYDTTTNQQFPIVTNEMIEKLKHKYAFSIWEKYDESHYVARFCTSWATKKEAVEELVADIKCL